MLLFPSACRKEAKPPQPAVSEPGIQDEASVNFEIPSLPSKNGERLFLATYSSQGKLAKFRIELDPLGPADSKSAPGSNFKFGKGAIKAEPGSDASALLPDLEKALAAKKLPSNVKRSDALQFTYAILGENESLSSGGGFSGKPPRDWTAMKIFIGTGEQIGTSEETDEGEVFLNFNTVSGKAQFSEKDQDYGDYVLAKLATVL
jgi:hypothetical protein